MKLASQWAFWIFFLITCVAWKALMITAIVQVNDGGYPSAHTCDSENDYAAFIHTDANGDQVKSGDGAVLDPSNPNFADYQKCVFGFNPAQCPAKLNNILTVLLVFSFIAVASLSLYILVALFPSAAYDKESDADKLMWTKSTVQRYGVIFATILGSFSMIPVLLTFLVLFYMDNERHISSYRCGFPNGYDAQWSLVFSFLPHLLGGVILAVYSSMSIHEADTGRSAEAIESEMQPLTARGRSVNMAPVMTHMANRGMLPANQS